VIAVDLHMHTCHSPDSGTSLEAIVRGCQRAGIDCAAVTDHNCIQGALELHSCGTIRVIVGEEIRTMEGELLGLFLSEVVPSGLTPLDTIARVKSQGGLVCLPHPFSRWPVFRSDKLGTKNGPGFTPSGSLRRWNRLLTPEVLSAIDMIEIVNSRTPFSGNLAASRRLALLCGLPGTAGSDAHTEREIGRARMEMPDFSDAQSFLAAVRSARVTGVRSSTLVHFASTYVKLRRKVC